MRYGGALVQSSFLLLDACAGLSAAGSYVREPDFHLLSQPRRAAQKIELVLSCQS
jgi:hypothetical protein